MSDEGESEVLEVVVPAGLDEMRIDRALSMLTGLSRSAAHRLLAEGLVTVDGEAVTKPSTSLVEGQVLMAALPEPDSGEVLPDASVAVDVVLDDEHFCVVSKRPGQVVHPGAGQNEGTLVSGLLARYPQIAELPRQGRGDPFRPGIVHRLDKGTSGLLVVAKTPLGFDELREQLAGHAMDRVYLGLSEGHVTEENGVVDAPIGRSTRSPVLMAVRPDGRWARTHYRVLARYDEPHTTTLLRLQLDTGRTHQIRVHLAAIGHPIVNDGRYGHRRDKRLPEERFFLHSWRLSFAHPLTGETVRTHSALPEDLAGLAPGFEEPEE